MTPTRLKLEQFESRDLPAVFGVPWSAPSLTVSFATDGTDVMGEQSSLYRTLAGDGLSTTVWQTEILRAFQTWARETNLNVGLVTDSGDAYGISGQVQNDTRFGDIRVFARPLDGGVLAITNAPGTNGTIAGDIILNSNFNFSVGGGNGTYDLYTVALHEFGHSLGMLGTSSSNSAMFENYQGALSGLFSGDVTQIRSIYSGIRSDRYDTTANTFATAYNLLDTLAPGTTSTKLSVNAEISSGDVDFYKFTTPTVLNSQVNIRLRVEGISLLDAKLTLLDANGNVLQTLSGIHSNLRLQLNLRANTTYFLKVEGVTNSLFNVGAYKLVVDLNPNTERIENNAGLTVASDSSTNDKLGQPTVLKNQSSATAQPSYAYAGRIETTRDLDVYLIASPTLAQMNGQPSNLIVTLSTMSNGLPVEVIFFDKNGVRLTPEIIQVTQSQRIYQLKNVNPSTSYYLRVGSGTIKNYATDYLLEAQFQSWALTPAFTQSLSLSGTQNTIYQSATLKTTQNVSISLNNLSTAEPINLKIYDRQSQTVISELTVSPSQIATIDLLLPAGDYDFKFTTRATNNKSIPFTFTILTISDPIGIDPLDPLYVPPPPPLLPPPPPPPPSGTELQRIATEVPPPPPPAPTPIYIAPSFSLYTYTPTFYYWF